MNRREFFEDSLCGLAGMSGLATSLSARGAFSMSASTDKKTFNEELAHVFGCSPNCVIDFYGMVENVGIIYPDCREGNKHVPVFGDVVVRDPLTLQPVRERQQGIVQVCSVLPTSFPGHLLLTEDLAEILSCDGCGCGRRGTSFRFVGRVPRAEVRGCGNIERARHQAN